MHRNYIIAGGGVLALILLGGWYFQRAANNNTQNGYVETTGTDTASTVLPLTINAKHLYARGVHYYRGLVETPTPCYDVTATSTENSDQGRTIVIATHDHGGICAQNIAQLSFNVSFVGATDTPVSALFNGKPAQLNIIEVSNHGDLLGPFDFKS